jgi:Dockerin type I domain
VVSRDAAGTILGNNGAVTIQSDPGVTVANTRMFMMTGAGGNDNLSMNEANGVMPAANGGCLHADAHQRRRRRRLHCHNQRGRRRHCGDAQRLRRGRLCSAPWPTATTSSRGLASQISDNGVLLDGSDDGSPGGNFVFGDAQGLFRFYGDINGDRHVDIADFGLLSNSIFDATNYKVAFDFNGDGVIDIADFGQFKVRIFATLQ